MHKSLYTFKTTGLTEKTWKTDLCFHCFQRNAYSFKSAIVLNAFCIVLLTLNNFAEAKAPRQIKIFIAVVDWNLQATMIVLWINGTDFVHVTFRFPGKLFVICFFYLPPRSKNSKRGSKPIAGGL